ncbi:MAG TPA: hypothetical protein VF992_05980 [Thermoplasmata archaeon]
MARLYRDADLGPIVDRRKAVEVMEEGYRADARGEVVPFPRTRTDARGVTLAWMGAAIPAFDLLGFRSYLYDSKGVDRGDQVVALYRYLTMELKALFLGSLVGNLRTGAAIAAALRIAQPNLRSLGLIGTGTQARQALACAAATFSLDSVWAWSPNPVRREEFRLWAERALNLRVHLGDGAAQVLRETAAIALVTSSNEPLVSSEMMPGPRLLVSISAYRRPEIDLRLLYEAPCVWTDSVAQASGPATLFHDPTRRGKLRPLAVDADQDALHDEESTRIVINTGAAWEEVLLAESLWRSSDQTQVGLRLDLSNDPLGPPRS